MRAAMVDWVRGVAVQVAVAKEWAAEVVAQVTTLVTGPVRCLRRWNGWVGGRLGGRKAA